MTRLVRAALYAAMGAVAFPLAAAAQEDPPPTTAPPPQTELVFEREVFRYPAFERRNPFLALAADAGGVRYEQLDLMGILWSDDPAESVCILGTGVFAVTEDGSGVTRQPGETWYAHAGETVGNVRIVEIHSDQIVVEVEMFGIMERRIMLLETRRLGGTS